MKLCNKKCIPCCDYCIHCIHELIFYKGKTTNGEPVGCFKHPDIEHQKIAESCGYCDDFHCLNVKEVEDNGN